MSLSKIFVGVCLVATVYHFVQKGRERVALSKIKPDEYGFVALSAPHNAPADKVFIVAPANCPKPAGRRADALERSLTRAGVPYVRTDRANFSYTTPVEDALRETVMQGEWPIVFIASHVKNSPDATDIISEYKLVRRK